MAKSFERVDRLRQQFLRYLAEVLRTSVKGYDLSAVTITEVELSRDYKCATAYYTVLGDEEKRSEIATILARVRSLVQSETGRRLGIRVVPQLQFKFDNAIERGARLGDLFSQIEDEREHRSPDNQED